MDGQQNQCNITDASLHLTTGLLHEDLKFKSRHLHDNGSQKMRFYYYKNHVFIVIALYLNKVSLNASINK